MMKSILETFTAQIISIKDKSRWKEIISGALEYDFYHTWYYHSLEDSGEAFMFLYEEENLFVAFPLIKKSIPDTYLFDCTSVYGYPGPISNRDMDSLSDETIFNFSKSLVEVLDSLNIVSVFSRLHTFFPQVDLFKPLQSIYENGKTVTIDLSLSLEEQRSKYRRTIRENINQLKRKNYYVKEIETRDDLAEFVSIYIENMKRIGASDYYLFDEKYFMNMLSSDEFSSKILMVYLADKPVCGTIITYTKSIIQGHLIGTRSDYLKDSPAKLLVDEITILGRKLGMRYFHLGGGLGGKEDSLFKWKAGFSDLFLNFYTFRHIVNEQEYANLVEKNKVDNQETDYFPLYRKIVNSK